MEALIRRRHYAVIVAAAMTSAFFGPAAVKIATHSLTEEMIQMKVREDLDTVWSRLEVASTKTFPAPSRARSNLGIPG